MRGGRTAAAPLAAPLTALLVALLTAACTSTSPTTGASAPGQHIAGGPGGATRTSTSPAASSAGAPSPPTPSRVGVTTSPPAVGCPQRLSTITSAPGTGRTVALTFDDGAGPATLAIARVLRSRGVTGTFFDVGRQDELRPAVVRQVAAWGFPVEDHSWDHQYPTMVPGGWTVTYLRDQITRTADLQQQLTGHRPCFFRPPGGFRTNVSQAAYGLGMSVVLWSVDTLDWRQPGLTTAAATAAIVARATAVGGQQHPIVLMHSGKASPEPASVVSPNRSNTVAALPAIIAWYAAHGYRFVAL